MRTDPRPARSPGLAIAGWAAASVFLIVLLAAGWVWCALAFEEEFSEESKAQAAGTTMAGLGATLGLIPVLVLHVLVLIGVFLAIRAGWRGIVFSVLVALVVVAVLSLPGFIAAQLLAGGSMFEPPVYVP